MIEENEGTNWRYVRIRKSKGPLLLRCFLLGSLVLTVKIIHVAHYNRITNQYMKERQNDESYSAVGSSRYQDELR